MKKRAMLLMAGLIITIVAEARHPQFTRLATPSDPTFDAARR